MNPADEEAVSDYLANRPEPDYPDARELAENAEWDAWFEDRQETRLKEERRARGAA